jgi:hypothetical protein
MLTTRNQSQLRRGFHCAVNSTGGWGPGYPSHCTDEEKQGLIPGKDRLFFSLKDSIQAGSEFRKVFYTADATSSFSRALRGNGGTLTTFV